MNTLIFWLDTDYIQVNDLYTLCTDTIPTTHYKRTLVYIIRTLDSQLNHLSVNVHKILESCLTLHPEQHNKRGEPKLNEHLEIRFKLIYQMFDTLKKTHTSTTSASSVTNTHTIAAMQTDTNTCIFTTKKSDKTS